MRYLYRSGLSGQSDGIGVVVGGLVVIWKSKMLESSLYLSENDLWLEIVNFSL